MLPFCTPSRNSHSRQKLQDGPQQYRHWCRKMKTHRGSSVPHKHVTEKDLLASFGNFADANVIANSQPSSSSYTCVYASSNHSEKEHADQRQSKCCGCLYIAKRKDTTPHSNTCRFKGSRASCAFICLKVKFNWRHKQPERVCKHNKCLPSKFCRRELLRRRIPLLRHISKYTLQDAAHDVSAGLAVGLAAIPMGMSYALLAGLPPAHGLYNNIIFPLVYAFLGTAPQVAVGTSAIEAMLSAEAVANVIGRDAPHQLWIETSVEFSFCVGMTMLCMNVLRLGQLSGFLADPVLGGFATGSAVAIAISQLRHVLGISIATTSTTFEILRSSIMRISEANWICCLISPLVVRLLFYILPALSGVLILIICRVLSQRCCRKVPLPESLFLMAIFLLFGRALNLDQEPFNVPSAGYVPRGLPPFEIPQFHSLRHFGNLFLQSLWYSAVHYVVHVSAAKAAISKMPKSVSSLRIDSNQEFLALGSSAIIGSFFQCFPPATSFSRTSIACLAGGRTPLYNIMWEGDWIVLFAATVFAPLLERLPIASLASVVLFGVHSMMNFGEAYHLFMLRSPDALLWIVSFTITLCFGAIEGLITSTVLSLLWLLKKSAWPTTAILGRLPGTLVYRNIKRFPMAKEVPGIKIFRFDASLNFSNAEFFRSKVSRLLNLSPAGTPTPTDRSNNLPSASIPELSTIETALAREADVVKTLPLSPNNSVDERDQMGTMPAPGIVAHSAINKEENKLESVEGCLEYPSFNCKEAKRSCECHVNDFKDFCSCGCHTVPASQDTTTSITANCSSNLYKRLELSTDNDEHASYSNCYNNVLTFQKPSKLTLPIRSRTFQHMCDMQQLKQDCYRDNAHTTVNKDWKSYSDGEDTDDHNTTDGCQDVKILISSEPPSSQSDPSSSESCFFNVIPDGGNHVDLCRPMNLQRCCSIQFIGNEDTTLEHETKSEKRQNDYDIRLCSRKLALRKNLSCCRPIANLIKEQQDLSCPKIMHSTNQTKVLIIDASSINDMDVTSIKMMQRLATQIHAKGCILLFANWKGPMRDFLERAHFYKTVPPENCFLGLHDAVIWAEAHYIKHYTIRKDDVIIAAAANAPTPLSTFNHFIIEKPYDLSSKCLHSSKPLKHSNDSDLFGECDCAITQAEGHYSDNESQRSSAACLQQFSRSNTLLRSRKHEEHDTLTLSEVGSSEINQEVSESNTEAVVTTSKYLMCTGDEHYPFNSPLHHHPSPTSYSKTWERVTTSTASFLRESRNSLE